MPNSRTKDKIYAGLSILVIILIIGSFAAVIDFLLRINKYVFSVDEKIVKEKTTVVDKAGFEGIKEKLYPKNNKAEEIIPGVPRENPAPSGETSEKTPLDESESSVSGK